MIFFMSVLSIGCVMFVLNVRKLSIVVMFGLIMFVFLLMFVSVIV